jgi:hypothetical protein
MSAEEARLREKLCLSETAIEDAFIAIYGHDDTLILRSIERALVLLTEARSLLSNAAQRTHRRGDRRTG